MLGSIDCNQRTSVPEEISYQTATTFFENENPSLINRNPEQGDENLPVIFSRWCAASNESRKWTTTRSARDLKSKALLR